MTTIKDGVELLRADCGTGISTDDVTDCGRQSSYSMHAAAALNSRIQLAGQ